MIDFFELDAAIAAGLKLVQAAMLPNGGFMAYPSLKATGNETPFMASLIGMALQNVAGDQAAAVREQIAMYLKTQASAAWTFNYWPRGSAQAAIEPYPDDLDDTACALMALRAANPAAISPTVLAAFVKQLVAQEAAEGGPYYTWITSPSAEPIAHDVDTAINANIAGLLHGEGIELPALTALIEAAIENEAYTTPYYPSPYPVMYFIARWYCGKLAPALRQQLRQWRTSSGTWPDTTATALATSALLNLGEPAAVLEPAVLELTRSLRANDGDHEAGVIYTEGDAGPVSALAVSIAFACEALALYRRAVTSAARTAQTTPAPHHQPDDPRAELIRTAAVASVQLRFSRLDADFNQVATVILGRILRQDSDRGIVLLAHWWARCLQSNQPTPLTGRLVGLGAANLFGWIAYTLYDDLLDGDGVPSQLPVANVSLRAAAGIITEAAGHDPAAARLTSDILDRIESANAWELAHCRATVDAETITIGRLPNYGDRHRLADRSLGHALGPVCLLLGQGYAPGNESINQTLVFFRHYLIARQLADDAHDWAADLARGQLNFVGVHLLRSAGVNQLTRANLPELLSTLQTNFWNEQVDTICQLIMEHIAQAEAALRANAALAKHEPILRLLDPLRQAAQEAEHGSAAARAFLSSYQGE